MRSHHSNLPLDVNPITTQGMKLGRIAARPCSRVQIPITVKELPDRNLPFLPLGLRQRWQRRRQVVRGVVVVVVLGADGRYVQVRVAASEGESLSALYGGHSRRGKKSIVW